MFLDFSKRPASVVKLNVALKSYGSQVELFHQDLLDRAQVALRNACKDTSLDIVARLHLLEIIVEHITCLYQVLE